ncbi:MAG: type I-C CRISPR-associated protein Cas7/Csd2 [Desulfobacterales bacterium]|uniref:Type I-C CRISPR-associated protein Cas7/Csd2 n=1 Tax=Candidatus Desulfatibia vada TaxID=2841696 RepID=A0A8J6TK64_9BACT|nr:type I-C CRISPR-associated protein Cas7/Csd2 [Candidatus Desulfatibia vada]
MSNPMKNRYDFVLIFDVKDGNPNGDPDAGNLPRIDPETGHGLITDVCLKRKVRDYVMLAKNLSLEFDIWVKSKSLTLNEQIQRAYAEDDAVKKAVEAWKAWQKDKKKNPKPARHYEDVARDWMCRNFYDIRTFGAVMSTSDKAEKDGVDGMSKIKKTAGQVRGPVQITFSRSVDPIVALEHSITVCAARKADKPVESQIGIQGRKNTVPYGLYVAHGFVSAHLAAQTGFGEDDLNLLWDALCNMFENDRSAARGLMSTQQLVIFKHNSALGNAPAHSLFKRVILTRKDDSKPARDFSDYKLEINKSNLPAGISIIERL